ncbi:hypothetical protein DIPPA_09990 [Diplonema papillatum]|nr:hypothetical protein DIPPA_09990 [Diplonema papillatum]
MMRNEKQETFATDVPRSKARSFEAPQLTGLMMRNEKQETFATDVPRSSVPHKRAPSKLYS